MRSIEGSRDDSRVATGRQSALTGVVKYPISVQHQAVVADCVDVADIRRSRPQACNGETRRDATERDGGW